MDDTKALSLAIEAHQSSKMYFDSSIRPHVEAGIKGFQSKHVAGSKYESEQYKLRSKLYRPKTRMVIRKNSAAFAEALFSTSDASSITPNNEADPDQRIASKFMQELVQYRLTRSIPWFVTALAAYQEAQSNGVVVSYQHWDYDVARRKDQPAIELRPVENIRLDPAANWVDPINSSPFVIDEIPMYVYDVRARMARMDRKTNAPMWKPMTETQLIAASCRQSDPIRLLRQGGRQDPTAQGANVRDFETVWVHRNIINWAGEDWFYYTLGTSGLLTSPVPMNEVYLHDTRPYVMGICEVEAHKTYPSGITHLGEPLQREINDLVNRQHDLLAQLLNKRYLVKRNKQVDVRSLTRFITGVTLVDDTDDVKEMISPDVNPSSFQSMDRLNSDFDEITGSFSQGSVANNRRLNETVGGMQLASADANQVSGLNLLTFKETWVEPVLRQLVRLERAYETDEVVMLTCGIKSKAIKDSLNALPANVFDHELYVSVNIAMGATSPATKMEKLLAAARGLADVLADGVLEKYGVKVTELIKEVMGFAGYKDGARFFDENVDPQVQSLTAMIAQLQAQLASKQEDPKLVQAKIDQIYAQIELYNAQRDVATANKVNTGVTAIYSAVQAAGVIAGAPAVAPMADEVMKAAGYTPPTPVGVDPNIISAVSHQSIADPANPDPSATPDVPPPVAPQSMGGSVLPATTNTNPTSPTPPSSPASPATGVDGGIETQDL